jgi:uncharacterized protein YwlG (UPF0340 family)
MTPIEAMEMELDRLMRIQDKVVGMHLKRINFQIAELQNRIDHTKEAL